MIRLEHMEDCCGCLACAAVCPVGAITMELNAEGFYIPGVDGGKCISCGKCERVCQRERSLADMTVMPNAGFMAANPDLSERAKSVDGGIAYLAAKTFILGGGYFCSARYKNGETVYCLTNEISELKDFVGSKYTQALLTVETMFAIRELLRKGIRVLFLGTPCQVLGLKYFLGDDSKGLITIDLICGGVMNDRVFKALLDDEESLAALHCATNLNFRDKECMIEGETRFNISITTPVQKAFLPAEVCETIHKAFERNLIKRSS